MEVTEEARPALEEEQAQTTECTVTVHESCPGRAVFTEADNTDGWIATDYTVELLR